MFHVIYFYSKDISHKNSNFFSEKLLVKGQMVYVFGFAHYIVSHHCSKRVTVYM